MAVADGDMLIHPPARDTPRDEACAVSPWRSIAATPGLSS